MTTPRDTEGRRWWQAASLADFTVKIVQMSDDDLMAMSEEIRGSLSMMQSQLESRGKTNLGWWRRTRAAMGFVAEKKHVLRGELRNRQRHRQTILDKKSAAKRLRRQRELAAIRGHIEDGELTTALMALVDLLDNSDSQDAA